MKCWINISSSLVYVWDTNRIRIAMMRCGLRANCRYVSQAQEFRTRIDVIPNKLEEFPEYFPSLIRECALAGRKCYNTAIVIFNGVLAFRHSNWKSHLIIVSSCLPHKQVNIRNSPFTYFWGAILMLSNPTSSIVSISGVLEVKIEEMDIFDFWQRSCFNLPLSSCSHLSLTNWFFQLKLSDYRSSYFRSETNNL